MPPAQETLAEEQRRYAAAEATAWHLADVYATSDIESNATPTKIDGVLYWDVRVMLDEREYPAEVRDLAAIAIQHVLDRKLFERHPRHEHLLVRKYRP